MIKKIYTNTLEYLYFLAATYGRDDLCDVHREATDTRADVAFGHFCEDGWRRRSGNTDATCSRAAGEGIKI